jgi:hypothetical protein
LLWGFLEETVMPPRKRTAAKRGTRTTAKRGSTKRERLKSRNATFFAKRSSTGRFKEMDDIGRSLKTDRRTKAKRTVKAGHGDKGDRKRAA